jgi:hypothetical protein
MGPDDDKLLWTQSGTLLEDYADTDSPLVVKVSPYYSRAEAAKRLRELAEGFEHGGAWMQPDTELPY